MIDLSIHELAEIRGAILAVLDEGRLVNGKREPWMFYPGPAEICAEMARECDANAEADILGTVDDIVVENDAGSRAQFRAQADALREAERRIQASDWHMDESGDCNEQRLDFACDVQNWLTKKITQG